MSSYEDPNEAKRYVGPFSAHNPVPTIKKYREEQEERREKAAQHEEEHEEVEHSNEVEERFMHSTDGGGTEQEGANGDAQEQQEAGAQQQQDSQAPQEDDSKPMIDTSQADAAAEDPRARRKELKKRKDQKAEREVTDPVTHLPVVIHDFTSQALKEVPENEDRFGSTSQTATGVSNKKKSPKQLRDELQHLQREHESMETLFPPPEVHAMKHELKHVYIYGVTFVLLGTALIAGFTWLIASVLTSRMRGSRHESASLLMWALWALLGIMTLVNVGLLAVGVRQWIDRRIDALWEDEVWQASDQISQRQESAHRTETVAWFNALLGSVWPLVNPDLFTSLADMLEDVMQASLPKMVQMVSVNDIGQGSESIRILGIKWLPTGAAARSVNEDGTLKQSKDTSSHQNDQQANGSAKDSGSNDQKHNPEQSQQTDDGSQQQVAEGLEAEEGDFVNVEIAFAYRAKSSRKSLKDRARDMHMYIAFYLPGTLKVPVWVDLRGLVGTMRMRLQLCPDPPFFDLCTITFLGQPKVDISCTPLSKHALNIMDVPFISNFVQSAVDAAMAQYVAPKSLNLDLKDMISGDDFKKDTNAKGVLVVNIKRGYDFKMGDAGIPMIKDGSSDPYVSVGWAKFGKPVWSTRLMLNEMEPWWDETAYILVTDEELNVDEMLRVQLWDSDRLTADDDLGRIEVGLRELMEGKESKGRMCSRSDGFRALEAGQSMPGKLEWSVGYFAKTPIQDSQLQKQTFDPNIRTDDQLQQEADRICQRKLREATVKEGRHKREADELDQQRKQELKRMEDAMIISAPPPDGYPSGIFSIQIHQITGLELENVSKTQAEKAGEASDEEEEGEDLPSAYCNILINHSKIFKTRTKPKNAKPFYNASTERYIADWRNTEVFVSVRDARVKEDDPLLGIVHLPLGEVFKERSQVNGFYPLAGGVGYGRIRLSMVWRSVQLQAPREAIGWEYGTLEIQPEVPPAEVPKELRGQKIKIRTDLGSGKMYPGKDDQSWHTKSKKSLMLPVRKRYSSALTISFQHHGMFGEKSSAFAVFWLKHMVDEEEQEVTLDVWKGDLERASKNALPEPGEKIGSIKLKLAFWDGLGAAHSHWATKDHNLREVIEVLNTARDILGQGDDSEKPGISDSGAAYHHAGSDSSDQEDSQPNGTDGNHIGIKGRAKSFRKHHEDLNKQNRGVMQWKIPRTAKWAKHKVEHLESKVENLFEHQSRQSGVETEVCAQDAMASSRPVTTSYSTGTAANVADTSTTYARGTSNQLVRTSNPSNPFYPTADYATTTSRPRTGRRSTGRPSTARPRTGVSTLGAENQEIICAISESRGISPTVGLAFVNLDTGEAVLSQISDSQTYVKTIHKLVVFNPTNILIVSTAANPKSKLFSIIEDSLEEIESNITLLDRRYWAETTGVEYIQQLAFSEDVESIKTAVSGNYYAVCCFAAVLKYVELGMSKTFPFHSLRVKYEPSEGSMFIDLSTIHSLELVQNLQNAKSRDCLFGRLNETLTPMGGHLLRSNILQPLTRPDILNTRYDAVEELSTKEEMFFAIRQALKPFLDVDKILTQLILIPVEPTLKDTEQAINNVIMLKQFVSLIKPVFEALTGARCETLCEIRDLCTTENVEPIQALIDNVINEDTTYASKPLDLRNQRTYAVKSGVNGLLDVARQTYKESMTDALQHISDLNNEHDLNFQTKFEQVRQFYLRLPTGDLEQRDLPAVFINVYRKKNMIECQTMELLKRNQKISNAHIEVLSMSDKAIKELISSVRGHMSILFKICESIALLDMLTSFAHLVTSHEYVRPQIGETLAIQAGRHPIKEKIQNTKFIPNDIYATQQQRFQIITGCNMSGKSTYIRSVALMTVMAQIGSFVPADRAFFSIVRQLFARVSIDDNIEANVSTFAAEMRETAFILKNVDPHSMVIIDELGRGTSTRDGLAIALAIAEALVESRALVWFATHFRDLARIMSERNGVVTYHLAVNMSEAQKMEMLYRVSGGVVQEEHYGLKLAQVVPLPRDVLEHAQLVSQTLDQLSKKRKKRSLAVLQARRRKVLLNLKEQIVQVKNGRMENEALRVWLKRLQDQFVVVMSALDEEAREIEEGVEGDEDGGDEGTGDGQDLVDEE